MVDKKVVNDEEPQRSLHSVWEQHFTSALQHAIWFVCYSEWVKIDYILK